MITVPVSQVLFIHGHPFDRTMWNPQLMALRHQYRVIAPDLRGYGKSRLGTEQVVTQEQFAEDLRRLLDQLQIARACIVGLSMGSPWSLGAAFRSAWRALYSPRRSLKPRRP